MGIEPTSLKAYEEVKLTLGARQRRVLAPFLRGLSFTNTELAHHLAMPINTVTPLNLPNVTVPAILPEDIFQG